MASAGAGSVWNPNSWHWEEKNCTARAHELLRTLLGEIEVSKDDITVKVKDVRYIRGSAEINIRRGKQIPVFELELKCSWVGFANKKKGSGTFEILSVSNLDIEDNDYDIAFRAHNSKCSPPVLQLMKSAGAKSIREKIKQFVSDLLSIGSSQAKLEADKRRRVDEAKIMKEAVKKKGAEKVKLSKEREVQEAQQRAAKNKVGEAAVKEMRGTGKNTAVSGTGSEWNPRSFHWEEADKSAWAKTRLRCLINGLTVNMPDRNITISKITKLSGEASISIRKQKKMIFYDFSLSAAWIGRLMDSDGNVVASISGTLTWPDIVQGDTDRSDCSISVTGTSTAHKHMQKLVQDKLLDAVLCKVSLLCEEMRAK